MLYFSPLEVFINILFNLLFYFFTKPYVILLNHKDH